MPPGAVIQASGEVPAAYRISMASLDPDAEPEGDEGAPQRATLRLIREPLSMDDDSEDDSEFDADEMERILAENESESDEDEEQVNGGPSDPSKSKKARKAAAEKEIKKLLNGSGMDLDEKKTNGVNGVSKKSKGKMPASDEDESEDDEEDSDEDSDGEVEEFVICTLDPHNVCISVFFAKFFNPLTVKCRTTTNRWTSPLARTSESGSRSLAPTAFSLLATTSSQRMITLTDTAWMMTARTNTTWSPMRMSLMRRMSLTI